AARVDHPVTSEHRRPKPGDRVRGGGETWRMGALTSVICPLSSDLRYRNAVMAEAAATTEKFQKSFPVSWQELHRDAKALAWRLSAMGNFTAVVAITRGGLVPAAIVARELEMRLIDTICVASYEHMTQGEVKILKAPTGDGAGLLIVDDL